MPRSWWVAWGEVSCEERCLSGPSCCPPLDTQNFNLALSSAIRNGQVEATKVLLAAGADKEAKDNVWGGTWGKGRGAWSASHTTSKSAPGSLVYTPCPLCPPEHSCSHLAPSADVVIAAASCIIRHPPSIFPHCPGERRVLWVKLSRRPVPQSCYPTPCICRMASRSLP